MKVVALTRTGSRGPSTRYRIEQYREALAARGIELTTLPLFGDAWFSILEWPGPLRPLAKAAYCLVRLGARLAQVARARGAGADLILVEQQLFPYLPAAVEELLWPRRTPTLLEFDDAIYLTWGHAPKLRRLCARADLVLVGNRFLEAWARAHARRTAVVPTTVVVSRYDKALDAQRLRRAAWEAPRGLGPTGNLAPSSLRVGWIGLRYNFPYLEALAPALAHLGRADPPAVFVVISSGRPTGPAWKDVRLETRAWSEATEAADLAGCDVGVMPLQDSEWARGKCGLKLLQCMAAGVPVVASPVGVNAELIQHGVNGLLADGPEEWQAALGRLAAEPALRARLGEAGRQTVEAAFSMEGWAGKLAETYGLAAGLAEDEGPRPAGPRRPS